jgi:hypothetical protein
MTDVTTADVTTTVDTYLSMWNETDPASRAETIRAAWTEDGHYVDPLMESKGYDELSAMVAGVQEQFPGSQFRRASGVDTHHGLVRFAWELIGADGVVAAGGIDIGVLAEDGRFSRIAGFLGDLPAAA